MTVLYLLPILFQGAVILVDEFYFHLRRGLPRWERVGHPLDTLTFLICILFSLLASPSERNIFIFTALSVLSCLFVTKDEFVHKEVCMGAENWLHALLFLLHPVSLYCFYRLWIGGDMHGFVVFQTAFITLFMLYQFIFWQVYRGSSQ